MQEQFFELMFSTRIYDTIIYMRCATLTSENPVLFLECSRKNIFPPLTTSLNIGTSLYDRKIKKSC